MVCCFKMLKQAVVVAPLVLIGINLNGCYDIYKETCIWHSDMTIKKCSYYGFRSCIQHCHYCINRDGPQECDQLKCVAYCAKNDDDGCLDNFKPLCEYAKLDGVFQNAACDVNCNGAVSQNPRKVLSLLVTGFLFSTLPTRQATIGVLLIFAAAQLHGCCSDPEPQLKNWEPDMGDFKKKADWVDDKGIWRGNPTWSFFKHIEVEDYECKNSDAARGICLVWTLHEWNCEEHDFGVCKCHKLSDPHKGNWCEEWGCHALEADQEICYLSKNTNSDGQSTESESCRYEEFPMNEQTYHQLVAAQEGGALTTGEPWYRWGYYSGLYRRLEEANATDLDVDTFVDVKEIENVSLIADHLYRSAIPPEEVLRGNSSEGNGTGVARQLNAYGGWPPADVYNPGARHIHFRYSGVCIVNGDNKAMARRRCDSWREIETEISQCKCLQGQKKACMRWTCEERDVGLFSVLFRTTQDINSYTEGSETEVYECKELAADETCKAWEGDISSREEVEWSRCECKGASCGTLGAVWICDEWELPKTMAWTHPHYGHKWVWFVFAEICSVCIFCFVLGDDDHTKDALPVGLCCSCCAGIIIFPFLIVTFGCYAWLAIGLPFWLLRGCCCSMMICGPAMKAAGDAIEGALENDKPQKVSSKERFKRGATKIIGKGNPRKKKQQKVAPEEEDPENSNQVVIA
mmetsp:Transcript_116907/g.212709  ORF Transcript_116907/g.212709 Transcript_116907/m.212709 type:complete len:688 (+) Transcript_116907:75-2138(+)